MAYEKCSTEVVLFLPSMLFSTLNNIYKAFSGVGYCGY